jgi:predicted dehydrogenase
MALVKSQPDLRAQIGVGMLGYGFMARAHCNAWRTIPYTFWPDGLRPSLVAIAGRTEEAVRDAATRYGFAEYSTDWRDIVAHGDVQVFDNVGTDDVHVEPVLAAIAAGKHVVCEKPLAHSGEESARMWRAAEKAGVKHLTCFNYRFMPAVRLAYDIIKDGGIGDIYQARFRYSQEWRTDPDAPLGSPVGALQIIGVHAIDQCRFLVGEIESVSARISSPVTTDRRLCRGRPVEQDDVVTILATVAGGIPVTIDASLVSRGRRNMLAWEINGSKGSLSWDLERLNVLNVYEHEASSTRGYAEAIVCEPEHPLTQPWWPSGHILGWEHGHINMIAHFLEAIAHDSAVAPLGATFEDGARAAAVCDAVVRGARDDSWITVSEDQNG